LSPRNEREIPRFARNDKNGGVLFPQSFQLVYFLADQLKKQQAEACSTLLRL
jgi:hypothetical protein